MKDRKNEIQNKEGSKMKGMAERWKCVLPGVVGVALLTWYFGVGASAQPEAVEVPPEFKGKVPERAARALFGSFDTMAENHIKFPDRPPVNLQCRALVGNVLMLIGSEGPEENFPTSLDAWRQSGYLLWEYSLLTDVTSAMTPELRNSREARLAWAKSATPGSFYLIRHVRTADNLVYYSAGCVLLPEGASPVPLHVTDRPIYFSLPRVWEWIPADEKKRKAEERLWVARAIQLDFAYRAYLVAKKDWPQKAADLQEVMGKEIAAAWDETLRKYADEVFMPRAREALEKRGFQPSAPPPRSGKLKPEPLR